jgi:hypothetical protein
MIFSPHGDTDIDVGLDSAKRLLADRFRMITGWRLIFLLLASICLTHRSKGQWVPPAALRNVPVLTDCNMTRHRVGVSLQPTLFWPEGAIFLCPKREREIDARCPGASRFFLVHEYGHLAMRTREEVVADEWAAKQLAMVPAERGTLRAAILYFVDEGSLFDPLYGAGFDRALRVARAAGIEERDWPLPLAAYAKAKAARIDNGIRLTLRVHDGYTNAAQMVVWVDRQPVGFLSNVDEKKPLDLPKLAPGRHHVQALQVWLYHAEPSGVKSEIARRLQAECEFESTGKENVAIELQFDGDKLSIRAEEFRRPESTTNP